MSDQYVDPVGRTYRGPDLGPGFGDTDSSVAALLAQGYGSAAGKGEVLRGRYDVGPRPYGASADARLRDWPESGKRDTKSSLDDFNAEFFERWNTPEFQSWLTSRMVALGARDTSTQSAYAFWVEMGEQTERARGTQWTPEQYIEYMSNGGLLKDIDQIESEMEAGAPLLGEDGEPLVNPIQTTTSTRYNDMNPLAANTAIDQMSMALLGRMATKSEMKRLRGVINGILKKNPDVSTTVTDSTDPNNQTSTTTTDAGMSASEAVQAVEMKMLRSSEGQAFNAGKLLEEAMRGL